MSTEPHAAPQALDEMSPELREITQQLTINLMTMSRIVAAATVDNMQCPACRLSAEVNARLAVAALPAMTAVTTGALTMDREAFLRRAGKAFDHMAGFALKNLAENRYDHVAPGAAARLGRLQ